MNKVQKEVVNEKNNKTEKTEEVEIDIKSNIDKFYNITQFSV